MGGFREDLHSSEDAVFGHAVVAAGKAAVLAVDAEVLWDQHATLRATARMYEKYGRWGAIAGDRGLVARDLVRVGAYAAAAVATLRPGRVFRAAMLAGAAGYLSLPVLRTLRSDEPQAVFLVPLALVVKDVAKGLGCVIGLWSRNTRQSKIAS